MSAPFSRLLLATEHSPFDAGAEALALALAQRCALPLQAVLPLVSNPEYEAAAPHLAAAAEREAALKVAELRSAATQAGVALDLQVRRGEELYEAIVAEARRCHSELIVLRRRGKRSFLANLLLGEMVSKVVAHAPCHTLIVPREARMWSRAVLVAAVSSAQGLRQVQTAAAVAAQCALPLHIISAVSGPEQRAKAQTFLDLASASARNAGVTVETACVEGKPYAAILQAAHDRGCDLLVLGSRGESAIDRARVGAVTQKVLGLSNHPVLVLHP